MKTPYNFSLDVIRVFAGVLVIIVHICLPIVNYPPFFNTPTYWFANILESISRISVPLFIMISGYLLLDADKKYSTMQFYKKRLSRIGIPMVVWPIFYIFWRILLFHETIKISDLPNMIFYMTIYYHLYFLFLIFGLYCITPLFKKTLPKLSILQKRTVIFLLFSIVIVGIALDRLVKPGVFNFSNIFVLFIPFIPYFIAGAILKEISPKKISSRFLFGLFGGLVILTAALTFLQMKFSGWTNTLVVNANVNRYFYDFLSITVVVMSITFYLAIANTSFLKHEKRKKLVGIIKTLAAATFGVYLLYPVIVDLLDFIPLFNLGHIYSPVWLFVGVKIIIAVVGSYGLVVLLRKVRGFSYLIG